MDVETQPRDLLAAIRSRLNRPLFWSLGSGITLLEEELGDGDRADVAHPPAPLRAANRDRPWPARAVDGLIAFNRMILAEEAAFRETRACSRTLQDMGRVAAVAVEVGAFVETGQAVLEIESDKAMVEAEGRAPAVPAPVRLARASPARRGMVASSPWQRDQASAIYLECLYDPSRWERYASALAKARGLLMSPLMPPLAWRLVGIAAATPAITRPRSRPAEPSPRRCMSRSIPASRCRRATSSTSPWCTTQRASTRRGSWRGALRRRAIGRKLEPRALEGAPIGFSGMARWRSAATCRSVRHGLP